MYLLGWIEMVLSFPASSRRLLMVQLVEKAADNSDISSTKDITAAYSVPCEIDGKFDLWVYKQTHISSF